MRLGAPKLKPLAVVVASGNPVVAAVAGPAFVASNERTGVATAGAVLLTRLKVDATGIVVVVGILPSPNPVPVAMVAVCFCSTKSQAGRSLRKSILLRILF